MELEPDKIPIATEPMIPVLLKELELSAAGFQKCADHKSTFVTILVASVGVVIALFQERLLDEAYLVWVPFIIWCLYLFYWNQDFNHVVYRSCLRIGEAKLASLLKGAAFTWGRDQYELAHTRRPLKHFFNICFAVVFSAIAGLSGFQGLKVYGASDFSCWLMVAAILTVYGATLYATGSAVQRTKRQTDALVREIMADHTWLTSEMAIPHQYGKTKAVGT